MEMFVPIEEIVAPIVASILSVWSLELYGSEMVVVPIDSRAAKRIAVFTCALATGNLCAIPTKGRPFIVTGG